MITEVKEVWESRYEQLRKQALEPDETLAQDHWGLGLLICKGVAEWMKAWRDPSGCQDMAAANQTPSRSLPCCSWRQEATLLLANMALSHCQI